jgi:LAS superfamily LD-carboxypeptidase LdcB
MLCLTVFITLPQLASSQQKLTTQELMGKGSPKLFGNGYKLREEAHLAFLKLKADALKDGIKIQVVSSYRNFDHQKRIWERKYNRYINQGLTAQQSIKKIIEYSTIPGTSRHHWGTDLDIVDANVKQPSSLLNPEHFNALGPFCKLKEWMDTNAEKYGFYLVYTERNDRKGFKYEPWHYTYKPLSSTYLKQYKSLDIKTILKNDKLEGSNAFTEQFINNYISENILDINPELL